MKWRSSPEEGKRQYLCGSVAQQNSGLLCPDTLFLPYSQTLHIESLD